MTKTWFGCWIFDKLQMLDFRREILDVQASRRISQVARLSGNIECFTNRQYVTISVVCTLGATIITHQLQHKSDLQDLAAYLSHITHLQNPHIQQFPQSKSSARSSHIPPPSNHNSLAIHITKQRTRHRQNHTRCLSCGSGSPQRNIGMRIRPCRLLLRLGYAQCDLVPIWRRHKGTFFLCGG
jgi:hypothetical protein